MEIKYDAVFGDYRFANSTCEIAMQSSFGEIIEMTFTQPIVIPEGWGMIAMRRIIRTPTWTVADQKAGKLPPIGSKYLAGSDKREFTCLFHGKGNGTVSVIGFNSDDEVTGYKVQYCYPIESPEEKAARLREEWCFNALGSASISSEMQHYEMKRLGEYVGNIYDALLSGDLPVPVKGE